MPTVSLCMIVKNEEAVLSRCLDSIGDFADEIIIVDTGSSDNTIEIARKYTDNVYEFDWDNDFSKARNFSFSKASCDYIMWLDADDVIYPNELARLSVLKDSLTSDVYMLKYVLSEKTNENSEFSFYRERILKREKQFLWVEPVHEYIAFSGSIAKRDIKIHHKKEKEYSDRNLKIYEDIISRNIPMSARANYYYARELKDNSQYEKAVNQFKHYLEMGDNSVNDNVCACLEIARCYAKIGEDDKTFNALISGFKYDLPRAEACCELGSYYIRKNNYRNAAFWYEMALFVPKPADAGFLEADLWDYIPHMQLSVCYDVLSDRARAIYHNKMALKSNPEDDAALKNFKYFSSE